jgi:MYXO-CTERM domain-containing protein
MAMLPADPMVSPGSTACGSTAINPAPTMPLLADGLLVHTSRFTTNQMAQVQLPAGFKCTNCVLQITEFMSAHTAPCFYHHCAIVTISDDPTNPPMDNDAATPMDEAGGCCSTSRGSGASALFALLIGALLLRRRRR